MKSEVWKIVLSLFCFSLLLGCNNNETIEDGKINYDVPRSDFTISLPDTWIVEEDNRRPTGDPFILNVKSEENETNLFGLTGHRFHEYQSKEGFIDRWFESYQNVDIEEVEFGVLTGYFGVSKLDENDYISLVGILGTDNQVVVILGNTQFEHRAEAKSLFEDVMSNVRLDEETPRKAELEERQRIGDSIFSIKRLRDYSFRQMEDLSWAEMSSMDGLAPKLSISTHFFDKKDIPGGWDIPSGWNIFVGEEGAQKWLLSNRYDDDNDVQSIEVNGMKGVVEEFELDEGQEAGNLMKAYFVCEDQGLALTLFGWSMLKEENEDVFYTALFSIECDENVEN